MDKKAVRMWGVEARLKLTDDVVKEKSHEIIDTLFSLDEFRQAEVIMYYVDMRREVATKDAIVHTIEMGKRVAVPKVKGEYGLLAIEIQSLDELKPGTFGVLEPVSDTEMPLGEIDLVIVPGVAFDSKGGRLGYGAGYYDNFLPKLKNGVKKFALSYDLQIVKTIPTEPHDIKMDAIITETKLLWT